MPASASAAPTPAPSVLPTAQCPGGACKTFGGDGCAANCTKESDVPFNFVPGVVGGSAIAPGASGIVMQPGVSGARPLTGSETLTIGKERNGQIPVVIKAATVQFAGGPQMRLHGGGARLRFVLSSARARWRPRRAAGRSSSPTE